LPFWHPEVGFTFILPQAQDFGEVEAVKTASCRAAEDAEKILFNRDEEDENNPTAKA